MKTHKFKTTINCGSCIKAVTPHLNKLEGVEEWNVDTNNPDKILEVKSDTLNEQEIKTAVEKAGFKAEPVQ
ncbi:copper chaperone [Pontibacter aydingkolensis]|uniref:Heavy-metal-associated domain-containing protein n=1 Tax=Pontibacter aydingkolensis TaxID=1911536 RepID=A0ABS7CSC6_9BACT|nr:heavy-metal-associated domain-containing protein [Pontibacter aydingkolensis]MBW7466746.1 heavy-metal-associated domain-containing protein [Pontibacter aydingkolensis]